MRRRFHTLRGLILTAALLSTAPVTAQEAAPVTTQEVAPVTASPPKPLELETFRNRAFDAYSQALADGKYTLLLFSRSHEINSFSRRMAKNLQDPYLAVYSAHFVAALVDDNHDEGGRHLAAALNIQRYPTLIVLKTDMDRLHVVGRIEGVFEPAEIDTVLRESLKAPEAPRVSKSAEKGDKEAAK